MSYEELAAAVAQLEDAILRHDEGEMQELLRATVEGYVPAARPQAAAKDEWQPVSRMLH